LGESSKFLIPEISHKGGRDGDINLSEGNLKKKGVARGGEGLEEEPRLKRDRGKPAGEEVRKAANQKNEMEIIPQIEQKQEGI